MTRPLLSASVALALALFVFAFRFLPIAGFSNDHYMHMAAGQQIAMGEWPSRDYVELGLPLMEALSAIPFLVLPNTPLLGEALLVAAMFASAAVFALYAARRLTGSWWIALLVVALGVVIFPRTYSYPKILAYAVGFLAMWRYVERPTRIVEVAIVVVVAFGLRHDHGLYLGVGGLLTIVLVAMPDGRAAVMQRVATFGAILLLLLSPYLSYVSAYDGLWRHVIRGIEMEAVESARGRSIPAFGWGPAPLDVNAVPWLFFLFHLLPLAAAVVVWLRWKRRADRRERAMVVPLLVVAVVANAGLIRDTLSARLPDAVVPASLILGWLIACAARLRPSPRTALAWTASAVVVAITMASAVTVGATKEQLEKAEMLGGPVRLQAHLRARVAELSERFPEAQVPSRLLAHLLPFLEYVDRCLAPNDHILIPAFAPEVTVWSRRPFAGGQVWFQAELLASEEDHRYVMNRLSLQRVPVAVLVMPSSDQVVARFAALGRYLHDHFTEVVRLEGDVDERAELAFDPRLAVGRDHQTGWYCYR